MKILLLGGTGVMGSHLTNILSDRGEKVVVTSRNRRKSSEVVDFVQGNAKDMDFLRSILREQWDAIVDFMVYTEDEFQKRISILLESTSHYVFLSTARVYDKIQGPIREESERLLDTSTDRVFLSTSEYALSKARQENMLYLSNKKNWTIIRPYITYGEKRFQLGNLEKEEWLYRALQGRTIVFSKDINDHLTTITYGLDVAIGIACIINNSDAFGETYHITNECAYRWREILDIYLDVLEKKLGNRPKIIYQNLSDYLLWNSSKYQILYDRLFDREFDNSKVNRFINTKEFVEVQLGLKKCLEEFLENPEFLKINWKSEAIKDKYAKERTPLNEIAGLKQKIKYLVFRYLIFNYNSK